MKQEKTIEFKSTAAWLLRNIVLLLEANLYNGWLDEEAFGWASCRDSSLVVRLRNGGNVRTDKMDQILAYLKHPVPPTKWKHDVLTPINLIRRVYE